MRAITATTLTALLFTCFKVTTQAIVARVAHPSSTLAEASLSASTHSHSITSTPLATTSTLSRSSATKRKESTNSISSPDDARSSKSKKTARESAADVTSAKLTIPTDSELRTWSLPNVVKAQRHVASRKQGHLYTLEERKEWEKLFSRHPLVQSRLNHERSDAKDAVQFYVSTYNRGDRVFSRYMHDTLINYLNATGAPPHYMKEVALEFNRMKQKLNRFRKKKLAEAQEISQSAQERRRRRTTKQVRDDVKSFVQYLGEIGLEKPAKMKAEEIEIESRKLFAKYSNDRRKAGQVMIDYLKKRKETKAKIEAIKYARRLYNNNSRAASDRLRAREMRKIQTLASRPSSSHTSLTREDHSNPASLQSASVLPTSAPAVSFSDEDVYKFDHGPWWDRDGVFK